MTGNDAINRSIIFESTFTNCGAIKAIIVQTAKKTGFKVEGDDAPCVKKKPANKVKKMTQNEAQGKMVILLYFIVENKMNAILIIYSMLSIPSPIPVILITIKLSKGSIAKTAIEREETNICLLCFVSVI